MPLLQAVPNVSEGRNTAVLRALADCLRAAPGVHFLGLDANPSAHRTVFTAAGEPGPLCHALFQFIRLAAEHIDMRLHHGAHPRLGAVDVCPLVPLQAISLLETVPYARALARRVGEELHLPVYLYEAAATAPERRNLAFLRRGQYESLPEKLRTLPPDFGPQEWNERTQQTGACLIGARNFLIAFNINLNTQDPVPARHLASRLRESGGGLRGVKAIGWYLENFKRAQVSCNITDFHTAPLPLVYETCRRQAEALGLQVTGSELVGLIPLEAILQAGRYYAPSETDPAALIHTAVQRLHVNELKPFDPAQHILQIKAGLVRL